MQFSQKQSRLESFDRNEFSQRSREVMYCIPYDIVLSSVNMWGTPKNSIFLEKEQGQNFAATKTRRILI